MEAIRVVHCADLHLGSELTGVPAKAAERRQELLRTFRKITEICKNESVDLLLIAGDLFEGSNIDPAIVRAVKSYLGTLDQTITAIVPGNHDYMSIDSPYADSDWPEQVVLFREGPQRIDFPQRGFALYGAAFNGTYIEHSLLPSFPPADPHRVNIGLLHGDLVSEGAVSSYNPVTENQIASSRLDYIALGHVHKRTDIRRIGQTAYAYAGCPDGRGFDERGEKGIYVGTIRPHQADLQFRPVCSRMYHTEEIDISNTANEPEIVRAILTGLQQRYGSGFERHYYKIRLAGSMTADAVFSADNLQDHLCDHLYFAKVQDATRIAADYAALAEESSLKGIFVRLLQEQILQQPDSHPIERNPLSRALDLGLRAFDGEVKLRVD